MGIHFEHDLSRTYIRLRQRQFWRLSMNGMHGGSAVNWPSTLQVLEAPQPLWTIMHSLGSKLDRTKGLLRLIC